MFNDTWKQTNITAGLLQLATEQFYFRKLEVKCAVQGHLWGGWWARRERDLFTFQVQIVKADQGLKTQPPGGKNVSLPVSLFNKQMVVCLKQEKCIWHKNVYYV